MKPLVYLDHASGTVLRPQAAEVIKRYAAELPFGNASSVHSLGRKQKKTVHDAREIIAKFLGADPSELIFTSGTTESVQLAYLAQQNKINSYLFCPTDHPSTLSLADHALKRGCNVEWMTWNPEQQRFEIPNKLWDTAYVSYASVNHETGIIPRFSPELTRATKSESTYTIHIDATQHVGKLDFHFKTMNADYASISGHKLGSLSGIGVLLMKQGAEQPLLWSHATQERGFRPGTENLLGILSLAAVCELGQDYFRREAEKIEHLRNEFERALISQMSGLEIVGKTSLRAPHISNLMFENLDNQTMLMALDLQGIAVSAGSACSAGAIQPSPVILAMGYKKPQAQSVLRFSFGWTSSASDVERTVEALVQLVDKMRSNKRYS